jgi:primosomal protein N' (replication factor Y)
VAVDVSLPHLDRPFDYTVRQPQSADATPGVRVRVRFAGALVDGFLLERLASSEHEGRLSALASVVSPEPVLTPELLQLARAVADRYAGTLADVLRLAIPPRHATVEREPTEPMQSVLPAADVGSEWARYRRGPALLRALADGRAPRAAWAALPGFARSDTSAADPPADPAGGRPHWVEAVAEAVTVTASVGRGAVVVLPDHRDVGQITHALSTPGRDVPHVVLTADLGPAERYRRWLRVLRGQVQVVVGTRSAVYAPVSRLGLIVVWDDGDDLHAEPRAPYPHTREVAALRAHQSGCALVYGGFARTAEVARMVERGFVESVVADRAEVRASAPRVRASGDALSDRDRLAAAARLPTVAWRAAHEALAHGPVLVQVPRRGYVPQLLCARCRSRLRCRSCHGPIGQTGPTGRPSCQWCGRAALPSQPCEECGHDRVVAAAVGARRTAEELGRAFPGVPVLTSGGRGVRPDVPSEPSLVVATPGAEPVTPEGYSAALLLDAWALLGRADLRADEEAVRRWMAAAALVRPAHLGGRVVVVADAALRPVQALVRWDPVRFSDQELAERQSLGLPPERRFAVVSGPPDSVSEFVQAVQLPEATQTFGPAEARTRSGEPAASWVATTSVAAAAELATRLRQASGQLSVRKHRVPRVRVDPAQLTL